MLHMTQQEKAKEVLWRLFYLPRHNRVGLSEKYLMSYASKHWVGKDERLSPDALIAEADRQVQTGQLDKFRRGSSWHYKPRKAPLPERQL